MSACGNDLSLVFDAIKFASQKHRYLKRKDGKTPYINHLIEVVQILSSVGKVEDAEILAAAALHDTIEDTDTQADELRAIFGEAVLKLVEECTDDTSLPKPERKRLQVLHAPLISARAKQIKIADKISNMGDMIAFPPTDWNLERRYKYLQWSNEVFQGLKGINQALDDLFEAVLKTSQQALKDHEPAPDLDHDHNHES